MRGRRGPKTQSRGDLGQASGQLLGNHNISDGPYDVPFHARPAAVKHVQLYHGPTHESHVSFSLGNGGCSPQRVSSSGGGWGPGTRPARSGSSCSPDARGAAASFLRSARRASLACWRSARARSRLRFLIEVGIMSSRRPSWAWFPSRSGSPIWLPYVGISLLDIRLSPSPYKVRWFFQDFDRIRIDP